MKKPDGSQFKRMKGSVLSHPVSGAVYHVMARGNHGQVAFQDNPDREPYLPAGRARASGFEVVVAGPEAKAERKEAESHLRDHSTTAPFSIRRNNEYDT